MNARMNPVVITIDGPAGTGKSTVAHGLARRLGLDFLDTGAMYRAAALIALREDIDPDDGATLAAAVERSGLHFDWSADPPALLIGDEVVSSAIRGMDVSSVVSIVAAQPAVRAVLVEQQRRIAEAHPRLVSEGRDQGSVVFPDASVRFYLDAAVEVRAQRRVNQLVAAGQSVDHDQIIEDIRQRDRRDASRTDGPLMRPPGAVMVDTGDATADEVITRLETIARERLPGAFE